MCLVGARLSVVSWVAPAPCGERAGESSSCSLGVPYLFLPGRGLNRSNSPSSRSTRARHTTPRWGSSHVPQHATRAPEPVLSLYPYVDCLDGGSTTWVGLEFNSIVSFDGSSVARPRVLVGVQFFNSSACRFVAERITVSFIDSTCSAIIARAAGGVVNWPGCLSVNRLSFGGSSVV